MRGPWFVLALLTLGSLLGCQRTRTLPEGQLLLDEGKLVDLTYTFDSTTVYWPTATPFRLETVAHGPSPAGYFYAANRFSAAEHGGTHMDAPSHFGEGQWAVDDVPLEQLIGPAVVVDVSDSVTGNPDYRCRKADLEAWEKAHGPIPGGAIVLLRTGWSKHWPDRKAYFGSDTPESTRTLHFPGFSEEAAKFLAEHRLVDAVGLDTPSLDYGPSTDFPAHRAFAEANLPGFENVANLRHLPETGAWVIALPMKIGKGTGAPLRMIAVLPQDAPKP
jgi:kynurenine formamidase